MLILTLSEYLHGPGKGLSGQSVPDYSEVSRIIRLNLFPELLENKLQRLFVDTAKEYHE